LLSESILKLLFEVLMNWDSFPRVIVCGLVASIILIALQRIPFPSRPAFLLARLCLLSAWFAGWVFIFTLVVIGFAMMPGLIYLAIFLGFYLRNSVFSFGGTAFGTARWAETQELAGMGMLSPGGLPVGLAPKITISDAIHYLRKGLSIESESVCRVMLAAIERKRLMLNIHHGVHTCVFAPAGKGKTTGLVIPFLMNCQESMVVLDIKGEIYLNTAEYRRRNLGHRIVVLDPYHQVTTSPDTLNPLDLINPASRFALDEIRAIAEAMVVRTGEEKEPHWNDSVELHFTAIIAYVMASNFDRNLQVVAAILANPEALAKVRIDMRESTAYGGMLERLGYQLSHFVEKELASTMTSSARHLRFLATEAVAESTVTSSFDPRDLSKGNMTIYLVIPPDKLQSLAGLIRLWVTCLLRAVVQTGLKQQTRIHMLLDEAAALGKLEAIENAIPQLRGFGLRMMFIFQSMGQLKKVYSEGQDQTFLSNMDTQIFFGVNDYQTAEYVSNRLGDTTIVTTSQNGGNSTGTNHDPQGMSSRSTGGNRGYSVQETGRKQLFPAEVMGLHERIAIIFTSGVPPFMTYLARHYEAGMMRWLNPMTGGMVIRRCIGLGILAIMIMAGGAIWLDQQPIRPFVQPSPHIAQPTPQQVTPWGQPLLKPMPPWNQPFPQQATPWNQPGLPLWQPLPKYSSPMWQPFPQQSPYFPR
jgi:type IV secretion system protein VirD4